MPPRAPFRPLPTNADPLLRPDEVARMLRCSRRTLQRWVKRGVLPQPIHLSVQKRLWRQSTIRALVEAREAAALASGRQEAPSC